MYIPVCSYGTLRAASHDRCDKCQVSRIGRLAAISYVSAILPVESTDTGDDTSSPSLETGVCVKCVRTGATAERETKRHAPTNIIIIGAGFGFKLWLRIQTQVQYTYLFRGSRQQHQHQHQHRVVYFSILDTYTFARQRSDCERRRVRVQLN
jgi:hypothetical protein